MSKLFSKGNLIIFGAILLLVVSCIIIKVCSSDNTIRASVSPLNVELGDPVFFSDSTPGISKVVWEFGDGEGSKQQKGSYVFKEIGKYKIRLTLDDTKSVSFFVNVRDRKSEESKKYVKIIAPKKAMVNERVVFMADGDADTWQWEFGESGVVDSREQNPIWVFSQVGTHEVRLVAGNMEYPIICEIEVVPEFVGGGVDDIGKKIEDDIMVHLQNIIDKRDFNQNYNYILNKYLARKANTMVLVNNVNENDFYSYCNGLKIMGKQQSTIIEDVVMENNPNGSIKRLLITQSSSK